jgi:cytochrome c oxidase cbb3-type subunit 3
MVSCKNVIRVTYPTIPNRYRFLNGFDVKMEEKMGLLVLGIVTLVMALVLIVLRFISFESGYVNDLIALGNYTVFILSVYVAFNYISRIRKNKPSAKERCEEWGGIDVDKKRLPFVLELAFIGGILAMFWYNTAGFHTQTSTNIAEWNEAVQQSAADETKREGASDEEKRSMGQALFAIHCASCHGVKADGMNGRAQDLRQRLLEKSVLHAIRHGANNFTSLYPAGMPGGLVNEEDAKAVAVFVAGGLKGPEPAVWLSACSSCHSQNGEGIAYIAPNLHTYSDELVKTVLNDGKSGAIGTMPGFKERFTDNQVKAVAFYLRSIANPSTRSK